MELVFYYWWFKLRPMNQASLKELSVQEFTPKSLPKKTLMAAYTKYWAGNTAKDHS